MLIGVPKEIKTLEHRVGLVPSSVKDSCGQDIVFSCKSGAVGFHQFHR
jgi:alanine dehydrogenase